MVDAVLKDKKLIVPAAAYLQGEYGLNGIFFGVPVQLGKNGIEKIIEYDLNDFERKALEESAEAVSESVEALRSLVNI